LFAQTKAAGSNDYGKFTIGTTGIAFVGGTTYTDTLTVASADGTTHVLTVNILATNDAPSGANHTVSMVEDVSHTFTKVEFGFTDVDGNNLAGVTISTLPAAADGLLLYGNSAVTANLLISVADIATGMLSYALGDEFTETLATPVLHLW
jgi:VCBS repeat-containing protein